MWVALDAGHGGKDPGAVANAAVEKEFNLSICQMVATVLPSDVRLVRSTDEWLPLSARGQKSFGSIFTISIHANAFMNDTARGSLAFYRPESKLAKIVALSILEKMPKELKARSKPLAASNDPSQPWLKRARNVIMAHSSPCVLLEAGFLTNATDRQALLNPEVRIDIRDAIVCGILAGINYVNITPRENLS